VDPVTKKLLNGLNCPICKAPIDICTIKFKGYNYGCAVNNDHYTILVDMCFLVVETVRVYDAKHQYIISNHYTGTKIKTTISVNETDPEGRVIFSFKEKVLALDKAYFDFRNFNAAKAVNRIKTIFVFQ
jgi:hypothetical protein